MNELTSLTKFISRRCRRSQCLSVILFTILGLTSPALALGPILPSTTWVRQFGTDGQDVGEGIAVDGTGNVYVSGFVTGNLAAPLVGGEGDVFLRKYDALGNVIWTDQFGTFASETSTCVATDSLGNAFVSGWTRGGLLGFGTNFGAEDAFLTKYDSAGNQLWVRQLGTNSNDESYGVTTDGLGNAYITGYTNGNLGAPKIGRSDAFLSKYDTLGNVVWTRQFGPKSEDISQGVATDSFGNVYIAGWFGDSNFPGGIFDPFLNKYDAFGNLVWTRQLGATHNASAAGVAADSFGNVFIAGTTGANIGGPPAGQGDVFVAKYGDTGNLIWVRQIGTNLNEIVNDVSADEFGNVYVAGHTTGNFGSINEGINDAFVAKFDAFGTLQSVAQLGTVGSDQAYAVAADQFGNAFISGYTERSFPGSSNLGSIDAYVAKVTLVPEPITLAIALQAAAILYAASRRRRFAGRKLGTRLD